MNIQELYQLYIQHPVVTTDSRHCPMGSIFIALKGDNFNGNLFAAQALKEGCAYAVVDEQIDGNEANNRIIPVANCLQTLQQLANYHRKQLGTTVIGITGTNGKTTTKELIAAVLSAQFKVLFTQGNLNNHIGVPLTLLNLRAEHEVAVIEMGANHPGEIAALVTIAEPDMGMITNVGKAHLEGFGSFEGVIKTKSELYDYLAAHAQPRTVFVRNEDTILLPLAKERQLPISPYGISANLPVSGKLISCSPYLALEWTMGMAKQRYEVQTKLVGSYNLDNVLAAIAIGHHFNVGGERIKAALAAYTPQNNRSQLKETESNHLIMDAYNANPTSMMAALTNFRDMKVSPKALILGDMLELGTGSLKEHQKIVDFVAASGFEQVYLVGKQFAQTQHAYATYEQVNELIAYLTEAKLRNNYILIKGSNGIRLNGVETVL